ncbi:MAG: cyclic nucleotide-binding domain-containing protein [Mycobacteriaceae bacterium]|nr:cyclic nucleotide-binding domain-containing protein [Mycobacteriaceae bacterium]
MSIETPAHAETPEPRSLSTAAARTLATTTKSVPQMQGITSRWLSRRLPWIQVNGGTYRVNRRLTYTLGNGKVEFSNSGSSVEVIPGDLRELAPLREFDNDTVLNELARRFEQREYGPGQVVAEFGNPMDQVIVIAHGRLSKVGSGKYGEQTAVGTLADGDFVGEECFTQPSAIWPATVRTDTAATVLVLPRAALQQVIDGATDLREHLDHVAAGPPKPVTRHGEVEVDIASGHDGEPILAGTFVDYDLTPREYQLSVAQSVLRVHSRVADLFNDPMNQVEQQLRLTIQALRERQEHDLVNNPDYGLLHNADLKQRIYTQSGPPTPDDFDELLSMRRSTKLFLAHPKAIAAFGRECNARGLYPDPVEVDGHRVPAWRGVPIFPCGKIPVSESQTTSVLAMRTGEEDQGVVGLFQTGIPDEYEPSLNVRFMGIDDQSIISYLVTAYYSAAVLVPDALGVLDNVQVARSVE